MGRPRALGPCRTCGAPAIYALGECKPCYEYRRRHRRARDAAAGEARRLERNLRELEVEAEYARTRDLYERAKRSLG